MRNLFPIIVLCALFGFGCTTPEITADSGSEDAPVGDTSDASDVGSVEDAPVDSGVEDAGSVEDAPADSGVEDAGSVEDASASDAPDAT